VPTTVDIDDLIDAQGIAAILGLAQRNTVSAYQRRYPTMPRPVLDLGPGRPRLWRRSDVVAWAAGHRRPLAPPRMPDAADRH
jgi:glutathione-regulated potassium-efflux system ancillary protein KefG